MAYKRTTNLIARRVNGGYSMSGLWDDIKGFGSGVLTAYGETKKQEGAASVVTTQAGAVIPGVTPGTVAPSSGPSMGTIALVGAAGIGLVLLLKKRKK